MRYVINVLLLLLCLVTPAAAQVSVNIGINLGSYPELVQVPGYPVYYAPRLSSNYFFYDGLHWVYDGDNWYSSSWYNGPWWLVGREVVPLYLLRVPVRYYRHPPPYFRGWRSDGPPRWGQHWGREWEQHRRGWDKWDRNSAPRPAPLPVYQRQYSGDRYPRVEQQPALHSQNYRYQPRDAVVRQHYQEQGVQRAPAPAQRSEPQREPPKRDVRQQERSTPPPPQQQSRPAVPPSPPPPQGRDERVPKPAASPQAAPQQGSPAVQREQPRPPQGAAPREQQAPRSQGEEKRPPGKGVSQEPQRGQGQRQEKDREKGPEKGQEKGQGRE